MRVMREVGLARGVGRATGCRGRREEAQQVGGGVGEQRSRRGGMGRGTVVWVARRAMETPYSWWDSQMVRERERWEKG